MKRPPPKIKKPAAPAVLPGVDALLGPLEQFIEEQSQIDPLFQQGSALMKKILQDLQGPTLPPNDSWIYRLYEKILCPTLSATKGAALPKTYVREFGRQAGRRMALALSERDELRPVYDRNQLTPAQNIRLLYGGVVYYLAQLLLRNALEAPQKAAAVFFDGFAQGQRQGFVGTDSTPIHLLLLVHRKQVMKMRSLAELYLFFQSLVKAERLSSNELGSPERLQTICRRLKLRLALRGRPKKK